MTNNKFTYDNDNYKTIEETRFIQTTFVIRTLTTLFWQFFFTFGMIAFTIYNETLKFFVNTYVSNIFMIGLIGSFIMMVYINCSSIKTKLQLSLFTVFQTMSLCAITTLYNSDIIMMAMVSTFGLAMGVGIYALTTKHNYTYLMSSLTSGLICLLVMGISNIWIQSKFIDSVEPYIGTILFLGYIIVDVQYFLRKKVSESNYNVDNLHIIASLNIYLDIVNIFLRLIEIYSKSDNKTKKYNKKKHGWW